MKYLIQASLLTALPALVAAQQDLHIRVENEDFRPRQIFSSVTTPSSTKGLTGVISTPAALTSAVGDGNAVSSLSRSSSHTTLTAEPLATTPVPTFHLQSTNPTAVPLASINAAQPSLATKPLDSTVVAGTVPTFLPGAPAIPNVALLKPSNYPALDKIPPIDSPEVQRWIQEVKDTGIAVPEFTPTNPGYLGGCLNNSASVGEDSRCWWTCGGCTRPTDISDCPTALDWGLTYDDGPSFYTSNLLAYLDQENLKSTFFVVGSRVISFPAILQTEYMSQHQIGVHTWSHPPLTTLTNEQIIAELGWTKKVIKDVLGVTPNMMRPPFGDIDDRVRAISLAMGLIPVMWTRISPLATFDTDDFNVHSGATSVEQVLQNWGNILSNVASRSSGFIVLEHDLFEQTVEVATGYILPDALAHKPRFTIQPVISCLKKKMSDAYIETNDNSTNPPALSAAVNAGLTKETKAPTPKKSSSDLLLLDQRAILMSLGTLAMGFGVGGLAFLRFSLV
ncbi:Chitin deacetylase [Psilocybe cubensis]|uniref:Chitin deacetylase n=2 Tax=Psilocybe cubensis TaxID=181762 RepID=A0ACB8HGX6_PSICU|nr:Chitin deacetylase [Psilocybe cubensis]KAH9487078.1 Chitin deacetylase [Psilocybe cubensis]